jgi:hypothetical protein
MPRTGAGHFPDNANDANALFYHGGYLHAMHQTATLWGDATKGRDKGGKRTTKDGRQD